MNKFSGLIDGGVNVAFRIYKVENTQQMIDQLALDISGAATDNTLLGNKFGKFFKTLMENEAADVDYNNY